LHVRIERVNLEMTGWDRSRGRSGLAVDTTTTNLEGELLEGIGEAGEGLVTRTSLGHEGNGTGRTSNLTVGDLHTGGLGDIVLEGRVGSRGHGPTAGGERARRISAEGRPRQHCAPRAIGGGEKINRNPKGSRRGGQLKGGGGLGWGRRGKQSGYEKLQDVGAG
jgi:hypothetical protein